MDRKINWYRTPIDKDLLKQLTRRNDSRRLLQAGSFLLIYEFFYRLFSFLTWNNYLHFRVSHMLHHQFTVHRGLDKEVILTPISFTLLDYLSWFFFDFRKFKMFIFTNIAHFFGNAEVDFFFWDPLFLPEDKHRKQMCNWARIVVIGHFILLGVFIYFQLWILIFVVFYVVVHPPVKICRQGTELHRVAGNAPVRNVGI